MSDDYLILVAYDGRGDGGMQQYYTVKAKSEDEALQKFVQYRVGYDQYDPDSVKEYETILAKVRKGYGFGDSVGVCKDRHGYCSITIIEEEDAQQD